MPGLVFHAVGFFVVLKNHKPVDIGCSGERGKQGNKELFCQVGTCAGIAVRMC
jgi:hypothetical protein